MFFSICACFGCKISGNKFVNGIIAQCSLFLERKLTVHNKMSPLLRHGIEIRLAKIQCHGKTIAVVFQEIRIKHNKT